MTSSTSKKRRRAITDAEKKALREYYLQNTDHKPSGKAMRQWFVEQFHHLPSESTISEILSNRYVHLDTTVIAPLSKKHRAAEWPDLEHVLFEWQQRMQRKEAAITGDILKKMANLFWDKLPQYQNVERPKFSTGWLDAFKKRYKLKKYVRHGDAGSVNMEDIEAELIEIREILKSYPTDDIYNMDESALFWKASPDATLATETTAGVKTSKARITINLCCNASGNHRIAPWYIGTAAKPRCFSGINIKNLSMVWRHNQKGWMTAVIFKEYLLWFNQQMHGRKVILLIDNFSAHNSGLDMITSDHDIIFTNVVVRFLPPNATSVCQPLDQGIIRAWKAHYRKQLLDYICNEYDHDRDPNITMHVLRAIRWGNKAWYDDLSSTTISNCWVKSRVLGPQYSVPTEEESKKNPRVAVMDEEDSETQPIIEQMKKTMDTLQISGRIRQVMNINQFLNPASEQIVENDEDIVSHLVECYEQYEERNYETDEEKDFIKMITIKEAMNALNTLRLYEEQQEEGNKTLIRQLDAEERWIQNRILTGAIQRNITDYF